MHTNYTVVFVMMLIVVVIVMSLFHLNKPPARQPDSAVINSGGEIEQPERPDSATEFASEPGVYIDGKPIQASRGDWWKGPINWVPTTCTISIVPADKAKGAMITNYDMDSGENRTSGYPLISNMFEPEIVQRDGVDVLVVADVDIAIANGKSTITVLVVDGQEYYLAEEVYK